MIVDQEKSTFDVDLEIAAKIINRSGILQTTVILSSCNKKIQMEFDSGEIFASAIDILRQHDIVPESSTNDSNQHFCIFNNEAMQKLLTIIEAKDQVSNPNKIPSYVLMNFYLNHKSNFDIKKVPPILTLPLELIIRIMEHLNYKDALNLVLVLVPGYLEFNPREIRGYFKYIKEKESDSLVLKKMPDRRTAYDYAELFIFANQKRPKLIGQGYCYNYDTKELFVWGTNIWGQLGLGDEKKRTIPERVLGLKGKKIKAIEGTGACTFALTDKGELYSWGTNDNGDLGLGHNEKRNTPQRILGLQNQEIVTIAVGHYGNLNATCIAITKTGQAFSWGKNSYCQLGLGKVNNQNTPQLILGLERLIDIKIKGHVLALNDKGEVYGWGENSYGQLGLGHNENRDTPQLVKELPKIVKIIAGEVYSIAITEMGEVFSWGRNCDGQLGLGDKESRNTPQQIPGLKGIKNIIAGQKYVLALTETGEVFGWGINVYGILGGESRLKPGRIEALKDIEIQEISARGAHALALTETGKVYSWGQNFNGELGLGNILQGTCTDIPHLISGLKDEKIVTIWAGEYASSMAVTDKNEVYICGCNGDGQLGVGGEKNCRLPVKMSFSVQPEQESEPVQSQQQPNRGCSIS